MRYAVWQSTQCKCSDRSVYWSTLAKGPSSYLRCTDASSIYVCPFYLTLVVGRVFACIFVSTFKICLVCVCVSNKKDPKQSISIAPGYFLSAGHFDVERSSFEKMFLRSAIHLTNGFVRVLAFLTFDWIFVLTRQSAKDHSSILRFVDSKNFDDLSFDRVISHVDPKNSCVGKGETSQKDTYQQPNGPKRCFVGDLCIYIYT